MTYVVATWQVVLAGVVMALLVVGLGGWESRSYNRHVLKFLKERRRRCVRCGGPLERDGVDGPSDAH